MNNIAILPTAHIPSPRSSAESSNLSDRYVPSEFEIARVSGGIDSDLVDAALEARDANPITAAHQDRRDQLAAIGRWDEAQDEHQQVLDMRATQAALDRAIARGEGGRTSRCGRHLEQVRDLAADVPAPEIDLDDELELA